MTTHTIPFTRPYKPLFNGIDDIHRPQQPPIVVGDGSSYVTLYDYENEEYRPDKPPRVEKNTIVYATRLQPDSVRVKSLCKHIKTRVPRERMHELRNTFFKCPKCGKISSLYFSATVSRWQHRVELYGDGWNTEEDFKVPENTRRTRTTPDKHSTSYKRNERVDGYDKTRAYGEM